MLNYLIVYKRKSEPSKYELQHHSGENRDEVSVPGIYNDYKYIIDNDGSNIIFFHIKKKNFRKTLRKKSWGCKL